MFYSAKYFQKVFFSDDFLFGFKGSPQTLSGHLFLKNHKLKTVEQQKGKK
jgi:hypothetical protein